MLGQLPGEMVPHFFRSLVIEGRFTLHADVLYGENAHHRVESVFKAFGLAFGQAVQPGGRDAASTQGDDGMIGVVDSRIGEFAIPL